MRYLLELVGNSHAASIHGVGSDCVIPGESMHLDVRARCACMHGICHE